MSQKAIHIYILMMVIVLIGCSETVEEKQGNEQEIAILYDNPDQGIRVLETESWFIEQETATSVKFKSEKIVVIISVIPKGKTTAEIKQELVNAAGNVAIVGEGVNFISWKSERKESIRSDVYIDEKQDHNIIMTMMTPHNEYEMNREKIEAFRWNVEFY